MAKKKKKKNLRKKNNKKKQNLRKRINVRLLNNEKDILKYTSRPTHVTHEIFDKNYATIHEINA